MAVNLSVGKNDLVSSVFFTEGQVFHIENLKREAKMLDWDSKAFSSSCTMVLNKQKHSLYILYICVYIFYWTNTHTAFAQNIEIGSLNFPCILLQNARFSLWFNCKHLCQVIVIFLLISYTNTVFSQISSIWVTLEECTDLELLLTIITNPALQQLLQEE